MTAVAWPETDMVRRFANNPKLLAQLVEAFDAIHGTPDGERRWEAGQAICDAVINADNELKSRSDALLGALTDLDAGLGSGGERDVLLLVGQCLIAGVAPPPEMAFVSN